MTTKKQSSDGLEKFVIGLFLLLGILGKFAFVGLKQINFKSIDVKMSIFIIMIGCFIPPLWEGLQLTQRYWLDYFAYLFFVIFLILSILGLGPVIKFAKMQNSINYAGLKNTQGQRPKLFKVIEIDEFRTKLLVSAIGIGSDRFETKKNDLESSFQQKVEDIKFSKDRKFVEIYLCSRELPTMIPYSEVTEMANNESSFLLGESLTGGFLTQKISNLPHLLIGGTTGGGKSVFFKSTILNLLKTTPHLQMYLIDLKKGVEVREFGELPNVTIAKDEHEAVNILEAIKKEMDKRYEYLEKSSQNKFIIPKKDKKDLIVLGIDEASVLYGKTNSNKERKELMVKARELTDDLAKLARAAGIHLIIATQKPIKDSIDTKTLENLPGRMSFKMSTHAGSNSMLGNAKAYSLPDVKGRAIWKGGNKFIEVQTPFISDEEIINEIGVIKEGFENKKYKNFQPLLSIDGEELKDQMLLETAISDAA